MEEQKIQRRSPNFPSLGLPRALELAERVYSKAFTSAVDTTIFLELMGFKGVSGASRTSMGALKQYGLVEGRDDNNRISKLAEQIIHPIGDLEKYSAILEAAKKPQIFQEIYDQFKGSLPDDKVLKSFLIRKHGFSESGSENLIKGLKETEDFISPIRTRYEDLLAGSDLNSAEHHVDSESAATITLPMVVQPSVASHAAEFLKVKLTAETTASVTFFGPITRPAVEKLIAYLNLSKDSYED